MANNHTRTTPRIFARSRDLRHSLTPAEARLWAYLRSHRDDRLGFRRQHAIGNYIADFCCPRQLLIIELDGSQHLEESEYDQKRTEELQARGYQVLRFWSGDVMNDIPGGNESDPGGDGIARGGTPLGPPILAEGLAGWSL